MTTSIIVTNKYGEQFKKVALKDLKRGDEFKRKPDAIKNFYKIHYNRKSYLQPTATYNCVADNDVWGSGIEINAKAYVYIDVNGAVNYNGVL
tara:strand:- start:365 stop:640 length:276 start_codon:yes stop_codon:yes gene_type:complete